MNITELKRRLEIMNLSEVSKRSGVPYSAIYHFTKGRNTKLDSVEKLIDWINSHDKGEDNGKQD